MSPPVVQLAWYRCFVSSVYTSSFSSDPRLTRLSSYRRLLLLGYTCKMITSLALALRWYSQGCFVAAIVVCYIIVYLPLIRKMDATIKRSRAMLLLFPSEVVNSVPSIRNVMTGMTTTACRGDSSISFSGSGSGARRSDREHLYD